jgi:pimeloyl-ACP methyl ester carboxylesterase
LVHVPTTTRFIKAGGLRFEVTECGDGQQLALCLHGFPENSFSWRYQLPFLARLGYRVWAPNLRGYGHSSRPAAISEYHIERLVEDVEGLIAAAGTNRVLLVGHDWGGIIAWMTALKHHVNLAGLVIVNAPHPAIFASRIWSWPQIRRSWYIFAFQIPGLPEFFLGRQSASAIVNAFVAMAVDKTRFPPEVLEVYRQYALIPGALRAMVNYYRANLTFLWDTRLRLNSLIEIPTLLIWGKQDTALGVNLTYGTNEFVSNLTTRYLPNVSHWAQQEAPDEVNNAIKTWLER